MSGSENNASRQSGTHIYAQHRIQHLGEIRTVLIGDGIGLAAPDLLLEHFVIVVCKGGTEDPRETVSACCTWMRTLEATTDVRQVAQLFPDTAQTPDIDGRVESDILHVRNAQLGSHIVQGLNE
jgi:hypothetical protein